MIAAISIELFLGISNIIRRSHRGIPAAFPHEIPKCILIILLIKTVKDNKQDDVSKELDT